MTIDDDHQRRQNIFASNIHQSLEETSLIGVCNLTCRSQKMSTAVETSCHPYNRNNRCREPRYGIENQSIQMYASCNCCRWSRESFLNLSIIWDIISFCTWPCGRQTMSRGSCPSEIEIKKLMRFHSVKRLNWFNWPIQTPPKALAWHRSRHMQLSHQWVNHIIGFSCCNPFLCIDLWSVSMIWNTFKLSCSNCHALQLWCWQYILDHFGWSVWWLPLSVFAIFAYFFLHLSFMLWPWFPGDPPGCYRRWFLVNSLVTLAIAPRIDLDVYDQPIGGRQKWP